MGSVQKIKTGISGFGSIGRLVASENPVRVFGVRSPEEILLAQNASAHLKDWRGGRASSFNIIPSGARAAKGVGKVLPALSRELSDMAYRASNMNISGVEPSVMPEKVAADEEIEKEIKSSVLDAKGGSASSRLRSVGTTKNAMPLFPFLGSTFLFLRDGAGMYNSHFLEHDREKYLGQLRQNCWNLMGSDKVTELVEKCIQLGGAGGLKKEMEMMIELILRSNRVPYGCNSYLNEVKKMRSLVSNRTNTSTSVESVKIKSIYQSAAMIAQEVCSQLRNKRSFRIIFGNIVKEIPQVLKHVEGIRIECAGRIQGAEIARVDVAKHGKISRTTIDQKVDFASAEVSTRSGLIGVKVWISYSKRKRGRATSKTDTVQSIS